MAASYTPRKGRWLEKERERKKKTGVAPAAKRRSYKRQKRATRAAIAVKASNSHLIVKGEDNEDCSEIVLMYNSV